MQTVLTHLVLDKERNAQVLLKIYEEEAGINDVKQSWTFHDESNVPDTYMGKAEMTQGVKRIMVDWSEVACMNDFFISGRQQCDIVEFCEPLMEHEESSRNAFKRRKMKAREG